MLFLTGEGSIILVLSFFETTLQINVKKYQHVLYIMSLCCVYFLAEKYKISMVFCMLITVLHVFLINCDL